MSRWLFPSSAAVASVVLIVAAFTIDTDTGTDAGAAPVPGWEPHRWQVGVKPDAVLEVAATRAPTVGLSGWALVIADCESGARLPDGSARRGSYDPTATNPSSSASGAFQALDSTWRWVTGLPGPASAYPLPVQAEFFESLWDDGAGARHWWPSRSCWGRHR